MKKIFLLLLLIPFLSGCNQGSNSPKDIVIACNAFDAKDISGCRDTDTFELNTIEISSDRFVNILNYSGERALLILLKNSSDPSYDGVAYKLWDLLDSKSKKRKINDLNTDEIKDLLYSSNFDMPPEEVVMQSFPFYFKVHDNKVIFTPEVGGDKEITSWETENANFSFW